MQQCFYAAHARPINDPCRCTLTFFPLIFFPAHASPLNTAGRAFQFAAAAAPPTFRRRLFFAPAASRSPVACSPHCEAQPGTTWPCYRQTYPCVARCACQKYLPESVFLTFFSSSVSRAAGQLLAGASHPLLRAYPSPVFPLHSRPFFPGGLGAPSLRRPAALLPCAFCGSTCLSCHCHLSPQHLPDLCHPSHKRLSLFTLPSLWPRLVSCRSSAARTAGRVLPERMEEGLGSSGCVKGWHRRGRSFFPRAKGRKGTLLTGTKQVSA